MQDGVCIAFVPDPDAPGRRAELEAALDGTPAGLGPTVPLARSPQSLARARAAHTLVAERRLDGGGLVVADEHLPALLLHGGDASLATDLRARALAPLADLRAGPRPRLGGGRARGGARRARRRPPSPRPPAAAAATGRPGRGGLSRSWPG